MRVDSQVPTDLGVFVRDAIAGCGGTSEISWRDASVVDASGRFVPGKSGQASGEGYHWRPAAPLTPGASYELVETSTSPSPRRLPFVAGAGPAPAPASIALAFVATDVPQTTYACCSSETLGSCGGGTCAVAKITHRWELTLTLADGSPLPWYLAVRPVPSPDVSSPPAPGATDCRDVTFGVLDGEPITKTVCVALGEVPAEPDRCGDVLTIYQNCDEPNATLTEQARACGATGHEKSGCAFDGHTPRGGLGALGCAGLLAVTWLSRSRARGSHRSRAASSLD